MHLALLKYKSVNSRGLYDDDGGGDDDRVDNDDDDEEEEVPVLRQVHILFQTS
jgi:hypothetical protein